ncbi:CHAT domain-containing protein [Stenotrophomonas acidaminiphila]|uniref:CHAT domain protein n=1 Tax=Stenotrophomonas acidaminiphila TaxID=128780 RepID=A0A0S1AX74_9GAMM|nr:CHAT domain-containing protein [Stenotrophomonas acidaminiphila]ALJ27414.1 CHAT domain protein [Stenotrophomonas acidaminiphila]
MSVDQYRRDVARHRQEIARLQTEKAREVAKVASERKRANDAAMAASRLKHASSVQSKLREAERYENSAVACQRKVADIETKIAREQARLNDASRRLEDAERQAARQAERRQAQEQQRRIQADNQRMSQIHGRLSHHDQLHHLAFSTLQKLQTPPSKIAVLFLAANPLDQQQLRLDEEARLIAEMIRKSEHRDAVRLESRWAVRPLDVLQAINECNPSIIHFSGHGSSEDEIVFQDASGNTKLVSKEAIVQTMVAGSDKIQLVFFNTCYSRNQAEAVVAHVPAAIGMNTSIGDDAARVFAAQFYSAIGFGHSVGRAFAQARAALMLEGIREEDTPELFVADGLDAEEMVLVNREP